MAVGALQTVSVKDRRGQHPNTRATQIKPTLPERAYTVAVRFNLPEELVPVFNALSKPERDALMEWALKEVVGKG